MVHVLVLAQGDPANLQRLTHTINHALGHGSAHEVKLLDFCMDREQLNRFLALIQQHEYKMDTLKGETREALGIMASEFGYSEKVPPVSVHDAALRIRHNCVLIPLGLREDGHHK